MKEKRGFTLVELLGVIAIIATLIAFVAPSIVGMMKRDEEKDYQRFLDDIYLATETYVNINIGNYPNLSTAGGTYTISMKDLVENGYVKTSVVNPRTDQRISTSDTVQVTRKADGSYEYQYTAR